MGREEPEKELQKPRKVYLWTYSVFQSWSDMLTTYQCGEGMEGHSNMKVSSWHHIPIPDPRMLQYLLLLLTVAHASEKSTQEILA